MREDGGYALIKDAIYKLGARINLGRFFLVLGILLMIFAAGLLADAVQNMQELGWLPFGTHVLWNTSSVLSEDSNFGDVMHAFFGYAEQPTVLQLLVWVSYIAIASTAFVRLSRRKRGGRGSTEMPVTEVVPATSDSLTTSEGSVG